MLFEDCLDWLIQFHFTFIRFELLLHKWTNEPLQVPEETIAAIPRATAMADEAGTNWNSPDAALELLRMKIRTNR